MPALDETVADFREKRLVLSDMTISGVLGNTCKESHGTSSLLARLIRRQAEDVARALPCFPYENRLDSMPNYPRQCQERVCPGKTFR